MGMADNNSGTDLQDRLDATVFWSKFSKTFDFVFLDEEPIRSSSD